MDLGQSARSAKLGDRLSEFMATHIYPNERRFYQEAERLGPWSEFPIVEELKPRARDAGLWNLFLPAAEPGGLSNLDYAPLRGHGALTSGAGSVQLQRAGHRQHGDDPSLR